MTFAVHTIAHPAPTRGIAASRFAIFSVPASFVRRKVGDYQDAKDENRRQQPVGLFVAHFFSPSGCKVITAFTGRLGISNVTALVLLGGGG
jgi:hypothetical protein